MSKYKVVVVNYLNWIGYMAPAELEAAAKISTRPELRRGDDNALYCQIVWI